MWRLLVYRLVYLGTVVLAVSFVQILAGCQDKPGPFRPAPGAARELSLPPGSPLQGAITEAPEFVIQQPIGPPPPIGAQLARTFAVALRNYGIVATTSPADGTKSIATSVQTLDIDPHVNIEIAWTVGGQGRDMPVAYRQRTLADLKAWQRADERLISRIAAQAAFHISRQLGRGDPTYIPIAALPDVLGTGAWPASPSIPESAPPPGASPAVAPGQHGTPPPPVGSPPPVSPPSRAPRVLVSAVTGPSSEAGRALVAAMRRALGESQMVLVDRAEAGTFLVQGSVELPPPADGRQRVIIRWFVKRGDGSLIGDLEQANTVRAGSLEGHWVQLAPVVAEAAVDSVVELIELDRSRSTR